MRFSGPGLMTSVVLLTFLVFATVKASDLEVEKKLSEKISKVTVKTALENKDSSLQPHRRSKRTIGHIFDMFKNMMDGLFGGGKKKKRRPKRPGQGYGPPKNPPSSYGPPKNPPSYGPPRTTKRPTYGNRPRPPTPPRPPQPPPPPRNPPLSGGYANGNAPPRPPQPPNNNYGGPNTPNDDSYGSPVAPPIPPRTPPPNNPDSYGSPVAPPIRTPSAPNPDSYGSPVAPPVRTPNQDSYGSPIAPPVPPRTPTPNQDSYGSPVAPPVRTPVGNSYSAQPQAPRAPAPVGNSYSSRPQAPRAPAPVGNSYSAQPQAPRAPVGNSYSAQPQAPRTPTGGSFGPSSVFYMIPAPNLATEGPGGAGGDSYGTPVAPPVRTPGGAGGDSYGSPVAPPVRTPVGAPDSSGGPVSAPDSYGGPEPAPRAPAPDSYSGPDSYGAPVLPDTDEIDINALGGRTPVLQNPNPENPFLKQSQYSNAAPLPVITTNDLSGKFVDQDGYGAPDGGGDVAPAPITDIDTPEGPEIIELKNEDYESIGDLGARTDALSEEVVPDVDPRDEEIAIPDIAPGEEDIAPAEDGTAAPAPADGYDYVGDNGIDDAEYVVDLRSNNEEEAPALLQELAPEGEVISTQVDEREGESSPLFDNLRDVAFTSADSPTTPAIERKPIQIDLSEGVADFTNGLDDTSGPGEIDLTLDSAADALDVRGDASLEYDYSQDLQEGYGGDTTPVPNINALEEQVLEYEEYESELPDNEYTEDDYIGNEDIPPELPEDLAEQANLDLRQSDEYEESFGQPASSDLTEGDGDVEYEYYYDYEEDYEVDPEQLPDDYSQDQRQATYSPATSPATPLTTGGINNDIVDLRSSELEQVRSGETNFISVPLMIEEVQQDTAPVFLAGTSGDLLSSFAGGGPQKATAKRRAPHAFHPVFQGWNLHHNVDAAETPQAKRQADWSQRVASARRNRVWRQFNLD